jgi:hypothetical protein
MKYSHSQAFVACMLCAMFLFNCGTMQMAGDTSQTGNTYIIGHVFNSNSEPAGSTEISAIPADYNPETDLSPSDVLKDTTSQDGRYSICAREGITYNIQAVHIINRTRLLIRGVAASTDSTFVSADTLRKPGIIKVILSSGIDASNGYLYIPGTTNYSLLSNTTGSVILDSVPAGVNLSIKYAVKGASILPQLVRDSIVVTSGGIMIIEYTDWKFSKKLILNTTASGAGVADTITDFPALIRLTGTNFIFAEAQSGGEDLRFTKSDGTPLPYEIERWDAVAQSAEIWARVDTIYGNDSAHYITMYWGNPSAASASNSPAVFDTGNGFQGVWHLKEGTGLPAKDATGNHFDGTPSATAPAAISGAIGVALQFNGVSSYLQMKGTASGKLNFPEQGTYSVSAWIYADTLDTSYAKIIEKNNFQYKLQIDIAKSWSFSEYENAIGFELTNSPATAKSWVYLAGIRSGNMQYLYVNGVCVNAAIFALPSSIARDTTTDLSIGKSAWNSVAEYFKGRIDEARVESMARGADWIKLCYINQKQDNALVVFK